MLEPSEDGGYAICVPSLPGCTSGGDRIEEDLTNIRETVELYLEPVGDDSEAGRGWIFASPFLTWRGEFRLCR